MRVLVSVTDNQWFRFLRSQPDIDEVNFWQPGGNREFRTLKPGEPLLFKLHSPENFIAGGGFFAHSSILPCSLAWEAFGVQNGVASLDEMRRRVEKYRRTPANPRVDYSIGCIILESPFFFADSDWISAPVDFSPNIVQGKTYDTDSSAGHQVWDPIRLRLQAIPVETSAQAESAMYGEPAFVRPRLGQGGFRVLVTDTYQRRCAVSGEKALPALEAAHIQAVAHGGRHRVDNGLLFRSDIHRLFDRGYVTVTPDHRFLVSRKLKDEFKNGEPYYPLSGRQIWLPNAVESRPNRQFLEWHADTLFKG